MRGFVSGVFGRSPGHRSRAIDGLNLFFGALLGANLGTLDGLRLVDYVKLIALLAATVMALRMVSNAERRLPALVLLGFYALLLTAIVVLPQLQPAGMKPADLHRLAATIAVWIVFALGLELLPAGARTDDTGGDT
ncbi:MAG: hypothetical protein ABIO80_07335 [Sphingomicrobium sp.]